MPWLCRRQGFPGLLPCLVWRRVPWSLACISVVLLLFSASLMVPIGLGVVVPKVLQNLSNRDRQQKFYTDFRTKVGELGVKLDEEKFPELAEKSVFARSLEEAVNPRGQFLVPVFATHKLCVMGRSVNAPLSSGRHGGDGLAFGP